MAWSHAPRRRVPAVVAFPASARAIVRRPRREPGAVLLLLVVCAASLLLAGVPRFAGRVTDDGLRQALEDAPLQTIGISVILEDRIGQSSSGDSFSDLARRGQEYRDGLAPAIQQAIGGSSYLVESPGFYPIDANRQPLYSSLLQYPTIRFRFENDVWERVTLVAGRMPAEHEPMRPSEAVGYPLSDTRGAAIDTSLPHIEVAMTAPMAESLHIGLNDRLALEASPIAGAAVAFGVSEPGRIIIQLVGLIEINDPADPVWFDDRRLHRPEIVRQGEALLIGAALLTAEDEDVYADLYRAAVIADRAPLNWTYSWRYRIDPTGVEAGALDPFLRDVRNLQATRGPLDVLIDEPEESLVRTSLPGVIERVLERERLFTTALALAAVSLLALALALVGLVSTLLVERRRAATILLRSRGASARQIIVAELFDATLYCVPAALAGLLLARVLVDGPPTVWSLAAALFVGGCAVLVRVGATMSVVRAPLGDLQREQPPRVRPSYGRLVLEGLVVVVAIAGLVLLRRRGLDSGATDNGRLPFDPYLAAVPVLLGAAVGLLSVRLIPLPLAALAALAARGRGIVAHLGLRRVSRRQAAGAMPTIVTVIAVGLAVFALGLASSIASAQSHDAWRATGADYRLEVGARDGAALDRVLQAGIDGIEATALVAVIPDTRYARDDQTYRTLSLVAVDPDTHARVVRATPAERHIPDAFGASSTEDGAPVPVLASAGFLAAQGVQVGDTILLEPGNVDVHATIAGTISDFPGVTDEQVVLVAYDDLAALTEQNGATLQPTLLFIRGEDGLADALRAAAGDLTVPDDFTILARSDVLAASRDSAFSLGISDGLRLTVVVATLLAALAIIVVQALSLAAHRRDFGYLRTLGLSTRQALALSLVEHLPLTIIAGVIGALLGVGLVHLIEPGLPLEGFTTQGAAIDPGVPFWPAVALTAAILCVVLVALLAFTLVTWRAQFERLARAGD